MITGLLFALLAQAQQQPPPPSQNPQSENQVLMSTLSDANNSAPDIIRNLEAFLKQYPNSGQRFEISRVLARAAIEAKDDRRTVLYGKKTLEASPDDMLLLDRVGRALLALGGKENAQESLRYSRAFAEKIQTAGAATGGDAARRQDDRDRGLSRALLYQARAETILGDAEAAERLAGQAYSTYPAEEAAREWASALDSLGRTKDAVDRYADAFAIPDSHALDSDRAEDRRRLGELYRKLHHSEKGLGDLILASYDSTRASVEARRAKLNALDPNFSATDAMQFRLTGLDGSQLTLGTLKGSVVIVDFWATWCGPCRQQHPLYEQVKQRFKDRSDVVFLAVDTDEDHQLVAPFLDRTGWSKKVYFEDGLQRFLQVSSIPTTILFDKDGRVASRMNGFLPDKFVDQLSDRIRSALSQ